MPLNGPTSNSDDAFSRMHSSEVTNTQPNLCEPIEDTAKRLIIENPLFRGRDLGLTFEMIEDVLVIHGRAPSFYLKQMVQAMLLRLDGIPRIENRIHVVSPGRLQRQ